MTTKERLTWEVDRLEDEVAELERKLRIKRSQLECKEATLKALTKAEAEHEEVGNGQR